VLAVAWVVMLPAAAVAASRRPGEWPGGYEFALIVYRLGSLICHQRPERSFAIAGAQLPVCARCAGLYAGAALMLIAGITRPSAATRAPDPAVARRLLLLAAAPTALTLAVEWTIGVMPAHWIRALSGALLGAALAWIVDTAWPPAES